jgi:adenine-specific DNA-methyltransferase
MDEKSLTPKQEKIDALRQVLPEVFTEGKIDWEKLQIALGEEINFANERYVLNWAGKSDAFRLMQQPTTKTLMPVRDESVNFDDTQNIFIEGDNLEVLKILQKSYFGKVKMIYIDPPYNTGNDSFIYSDRFSETKAEYQKRIGDKDDKGYVTSEGIFRKNSRENGQYHSNWLNMMMPRLFLARNLLRDDGVIFISIDDNEVHNLRLLMNEIFGEENFVCQFVWQRAFSPKNDAKFVSNSHDYILMYSKQIDIFEIGRLPRTEKANARYSNPDNDPRGVWMSSDISVKTYTPENDYSITAPSGRIIEPPAGRCWRLSKKAFFERLQDNRIWFGPDGDNTPRIKRFLSDLRKDGMTPTSLLLHTEVGHSQEGAQEVTKLLEAGVFDGPKPVRLIRRLLTLANLDKDSLILDFFAGSATTAHAIMELNKEDSGNRKYILVQIPEPCDEKSKAYKVGYKTIADIAKERIRRAGKKLQYEIETENKKKETLLNFDNQENQRTSVDIGFKVFRLTESSFKQWKQLENYSAETLSEQMKLFIDPVAENANLQNMVYELLLKSGKDLNVNIEICNGYHLIEGNELALILEKVDEQIITEVLSKQPQKVIVLDRIFKGNDQLKTNTALQMKDAGVEFKTI